MSRERGDSAGNTISGFENAVGGNGSDALRGSNIANFLSGGRGDDRLFGKVGDDTIVGGAGADTMDGGGGIDTLIGGPQGDTCAFVLGSGRDVVADFAVGFDLIYLDLGPAFDTFEEIMSVAVTANGRTTFTFDASTVLS